MVLFTRPRCYVATKRAIKSFDTLCKCSLNHLSIISLHESKISSSSLLCWQYWLRLVALNWIWIWHVFRCLVLSVVSCSSDSCDKRFKHFVLSTLILVFPLKVVRSSSEKHSHFSRPIYSNIGVSKTCRAPPIDSIIQSLVQFQANISW